MPPQRLIIALTIVVGGCNASEADALRDQHGGWLWGEYTGGGRLVSAGKNDDTCVGCHSSGDDQVRAFGLPPYDEE